MLGFVFVGEAFRLLVFVRTNDIAFRGTPTPTTKFVETTKVAQTDTVSSLPSFLRKKAE